MADNQMTLSIASIDQNHRVLDPKAKSHRNTSSSDRKSHNHRCRSQEKFRFDHNHFTHSKIVKAIHDIPHETMNYHEHKHIHEEHHRTVVIKKRLVSENILLDTFPEQ
ncbi:hypothetical protein SteCoe_39010 [Stentor coeruleus]|uniref:Uncharacterized protein n=1 Tax=Stentor coeruleus TaxID=5963 RepID=A0A1R2AKV6_9CILI|nr:hypothetical protein SteCoe_39010 [Stentor coeruleus]